MVQICRQITYNIRAVLGGAWPNFRKQTARGSLSSLWGRGACAAGLCSNQFLSNVGALIIICITYTVFGCTYCNYYSNFSIIQAPTLGLGCFGRWWDRKRNSLPQSCFESASPGDTTLSPWHKILLSHTGDPRSYCLRG